MSDASAAPSKPAKKAKGKKQDAPTHPPYKSMINAAIKTLKEKNGSSRQAILKYIVSHYKVGDEKKAGSRLRLALRREVASGDIKQSKGSGASGSFKLAKDTKPTPKKAPKKKPAKKTAKPKKPVAKKASKPKKPAAKKAPKKAAAAKKSPKKPAAKKTVSKKPAAKKAPIKKAK